MWVLVVPVKPNFLAIYLNPCLATLTQTRLALLLAELQMLRRNAWTWPLPRRCSWTPLRPLCPLPLLWCQVRGPSSCRSTSSKTKPGGQQSKPIKKEKGKGKLADESLPSTPRETKKPVPGSHGSHVYSCMSLTLRIINF